MKTPRTDKAWKAYKHSGNAQHIRSESCRLETELAEVTKELADAQSDIAEEIKQSQIYKAKLEKCRTALDKIASWGEGAVVAPSFDESHSAKLAREVLDETK